MEEEKVSVDQPEIKEKEKEKEKKEKGKKDKKDKKAKDKEGDGKEKTKDAEALKRKLEKLDAQMKALEVKKEGILKLLVAAEGSGAADSGGFVEQTSPSA